VEEAEHSLAVAVEAGRIVALEELKSNKELIDFYR
jgi:hypothetical protein